ncbi:hypothetical protein CRG98_024328 [Punica granatum]|uniref:Uncharacterized protein n=1 Tax=Punica granatum TaxID=22663 RepID=A0A2I0JGD9_PUNGR|nr:hypothetical protein CRG98_024328 [Punica granatum]
MRTAEPTTRERIVIEEVLYGVMQLDEVGPNRTKIIKDIESRRNTHPSQEEKAMSITPNLRTQEWMLAVEGPDPWPLQWRRWRASLSAYATMVEKRKQLKDVISNNTSRLTVVSSTVQVEDVLEEEEELLLKERPRKTTPLKRELTWTRPSRAVTYTLDFPPLLVVLP